MALRILHNGTSQSPRVRSALNSFFNGATNGCIYFPIKLTTASSVTTLILVSAADVSFSYPISFGITSGSMFGQCLGPTTQARPSINLLFNNGLWTTAAVRVVGGSVAQLIIGGTLAASGSFPDATMLLQDARIYVGHDDEGGEVADTVDYNIGSLVCWRNTIPTVAQINDITLGNITPQSIGTSPNRLHWNFEQILPGSPQAVVNGDAGLTDADNSVALLNDGSGGLVQWNSDVYVYTPNFVVDSATVRVGTSGGTICFGFKDHAGLPVTPTDATSPAITGPSYTINGGSPIYCTADGTSTSNRPLGFIDGDLVIFRMPTLAADTDVVAVTVPYGLYLNPLGFPNQATTITATNYTGIMTPECDGHVDAGGPIIGVCSNGADTHTQEQVNCNLILNSTLSDGELTQWYVENHSGVVTLDVNGNPVSQTGTGFVTSQILGGLDAGDYTVLWTGSGDLTVIDGQSGSGVTGGGTVTTLGSVHRRIYTIAQNTTIWIRLNGLPATNVAVLPPGGVDGTGFAQIGLINPDWATRYNGYVKTFRDVQAANNISRGWADRTPDNYRSVWLLESGIKTITSFTPFTPTGGGPTGTYFSYIGTVNAYRCVTSAPHGFVTGSLAKLSNTGGAYQSGGLDGVDPTPIVVDSPTSFYLNYNIPAVPTNLTGNVQLWNQYNGASPAGKFIGDQSYQSTVGRCNAANMHLHWCSRILWSDADITAAVTYIATNLNAGLQLHVEFVNENWNSGFIEFGICNFFGSGLGISGAEWSALRSAQVMRAARLAWLAVRPTDGANFIALFAWQAPSASQAASLIAYANSYWSGQGYPGKAHDSIYMAPYTGGALSSFGGNQRLADFLLSGGIATPGQCLDVAELDVPANEDPILSQYKTLVADVYGITLGCYEWMLYLTSHFGAGASQTVESGLPLHNYPAGSDDAITQVFLQLQRDPRAGYIEIATFNKFAQYGVVRANYLTSIGEGTRFGSGGQYERPWQLPVFTQNPDLTSTNAPYAPKAAAVRAMAGSPATPTVTVSPTSAPASTSLTVTLTGTLTTWTEATPATLFSISGVIGCTLGVPTITTDTHATAILTLGATVGTLIITDTSTGATCAFGVTAAVIITPSGQGCVVNDVFWGLPAMGAPIILHGFPKHHITVAFAFANWFSTSIAVEALEAMSIDPSMTTPIDVYVQPPAPPVSHPLLPYLVVHPQIMEATWPVCF